MIMGTKKWTTIVTFICTIVAIAFMIIFRLYNFNDNIGYDIALAVFGSALLGFIMSLIEYFSERRKAMEEFWCEAQHVLVQFRNAKCIYLDEPKGLVADCIVENHYNKSAKQFASGIVEVFDLQESHVFQEKYTKWMREYDCISFAEEENLDAILEQVYVMKMDNYEKEINDAIDNYIELSKISLSRLDSAYGNLNFIFANKSIRTNAYKYIFDKMRKLQSKIHKETYHFNHYKEEKGNFAVCVQKALEVSRLLFDEKKKERNGLDIVNVYQKEFDDIEDDLERFRTRIYFKEIKMPIERVPVFERIKNIRDDA